MVAYYIYFLLHRSSDYLSRFEVAFLPSYEEVDGMAHEVGVS